MADLLTPTRRGFLGGLVGLIASPAIIKLAPVMRLSTTDTWGLSGVIASGKIAEEANRILRQLGTRPISEGLMAITGLKQSHVDVEYSSQDREMSMQEFSRRLLHPTMEQLHKYLNGRKVGMGLELPKGCTETEICSKGNVEVRFISCYSIVTDSIISRFDVRHE